MRTSTPVCIDAIGETWTGYVAEGAEKGRMVLATVGSGAPHGRVLELAKKAVQVRHPNVLAFLEIIEADDSFALVSEYLDGEPLSTLLTSADAQSLPVPQGVALSIVKESIDTLVKLRRDAPESFPVGGLSPDVIFVAAFGEAMLRNPGIVAHAMSFAECRNHPSSLPYRAPEQLRASPRLDETVDVFSAGVILWELLAGKPLFGGRNHHRLGRLKALPPDQVEELQGRLRTMEIPSLATIQKAGGALHADVIALVKHALERDPNDRPASLRVLSERLAALPAGLLASPVEIATTIEKLAGKAIKRRQVALQERAPVPVFGSKPPSSRVTSPPTEGDRATIEIPAGPPVEGLGSLLEVTDAPLPPDMRTDSADSILDSERATSPLRRLIEDPFDAKTKTPQHSREGSLAPHSEAEPTSLSPHTKGRGDSTSGAQVRTELEKSTKSRVFAVLAVLFFVVGAGGGLTYLSQGGSRAGVGQEVKAEGEDPTVAALEETESSEVGARSQALDEETGATAAEEGEPAVEARPEPDREGQEGEADGEKSPAPAVAPRPSTTSTKGKKKPSDSGGAFRPMGI